MPRKSDEGGIDEDTIVNGILTLFSIFAFILFAGPHYLMDIWTPFAFMLNVLTFILVIKLIITFFRHDAKDITQVLKPFSSKWGEWKQNREIRIENPSQEPPLVVAYQQLCDAGRWLQTKKQTLKEWVFKKRAQYRSDDQLSNQPPTETDE